MSVHEEASSLISPLRKLLLAKPILGTTRIPFLFDMATPLPSSPESVPNPPVPATIQTPSTVTSTPTTTPKTTKKKRIRFSAAWDLFLLKAISAVDAHTAPHGETQPRFEEALQIFLAAVPESWLATVTATSWKTLNDRFKKIISEHRKAVNCNAVASGIIEVRGERETLLDDLILEIDEFEERRRTERDEGTELDKRLVAAGAQMRARALSRERSLDRESGEESEQKRKKRPLIVDSDDEEQDMISAHIAARREIEGKRLKLEEDMFCFEQRREEREESRLQRAQELEEKRLTLEAKRIDMEEKRAAMDREQIKQYAAERTATLDVLAALAKKLQ
ncbi:hypothetical protein BWQ96_01004 [Gracilariopsis chorda]|uniref:Uncharacterized protein n=1 Tax=Gracilariopsis chorda TaxID=448386 RepID=A0A2V3J4A1_9FLOR|nr:hypothetical protein BWQ96_01004 [Gracilariopsis chorda]|eukprot:PXF49215.1 hypothetical protein BWQ96_01004 [Gracilariopsis chorda]